MNDYLFAFVATALTVVLCKMLVPDGEELGKHLRLLTSLLLIVALLPPILSLVDGAERLARGEIDLPWSEERIDGNYQEELQEVLDAASASYFSDMLTQQIENRFAIARGEVRCAVQWQKAGEQLTPERVTVVLSGSAIWKDPAEIEEFVSALLGCECVSAIE